MQALIDFDGWRKWKEVAVENNLKGGASPVPPPSKGVKDIPSKRQSGVSPAVKEDIDGLEKVRKEDSPDTVVGP